MSSTSLQIVSRFSINLLWVLLQLHLELPGLDPQLGGAVPPVRGGRTGWPRAGRRCPEEAGVVRTAWQVGVGSVGRERGEHGVEGGHGGVVGEGGWLGGGQGQGCRVEAGRQEWRPQVGQQRVGRDLAAPVGDERREAHTDTGRQGARL